MKIKVIPAGIDRLKPKPINETDLGFGDIFTDHMFLMEYEQTKGWFNARIIPDSYLKISPAAMGIHYGQNIFEGLKAYYGKDGGIYLFRARDNFKRLNRSAVRLCMPEVDVELVLNGMKKLILMDREWIPRSTDTCLYIRPTMLATEPHLGVRAANQYLFFIILLPVGTYTGKNEKGISPINIYVEDNYIRAAVGGTGEIKAAGNYAAGVLAAEEAKKKGFAQVLWLDAAKRKYVEEVGTMNLFFVMENEVVTAPLTGSILPGITRDSVIHRMRDWGLTVSERPIAIDEVISGAQNGRLKEAFGTGTAVVITPVRQLTYKGESYVLADGKIGKQCRRLYKEILAIQHGEARDPHGWTERIN